MKEILVDAYSRKGKTVREHTRRVGVNRSSGQKQSNLSLNVLQDALTKTKKDLGSDSASASKSSNIVHISYPSNTKTTNNVNQKYQKQQSANISHLGAEVLAAAAYKPDTSNLNLPSGYQMAEKYADPKTGLAVSVFVSPNAKPVISFRGTEFGSGDIRDVLSDVDFRGIGYGQFNDNKQALSAIASKYPGATVTGHSLGGALAQRYAAEFNNAGEVITFNAPGVDKATAGKFKKGATKVTHYVAHGDAVSLGGESFIDGDAKIISYKSGKIPVIGNMYDKHMAAVTGGLMGLKDAQVKTISAAELSNPNFKYGGKQATSFTDRRAIENRRKLAGIAASPLNPIVGFAGKALGMVGIGNN